MYPLSKRALRMMLEIKVGQEKLTTDKIDWAMASVQVDYKEQAVKCAKAYLQIRNSLGIPSDINDLINILQFELFEEKEAKHGAGIAYNETKSRDIGGLNGALKEEIAELKLAYEREMKYEVYGIGTSVINENVEKCGLSRNDGTEVELKKYDNEMYEKRKAKGVEYAKKTCNEKWYISKKVLIDLLKKQGYDSDIAQYASNNSNISWAAQAFKTAMVIKIETPNIDKENFVEELLGYDFTKGEANAAVQKVYDADPGGFIENVTDEDKIQKLMISGFDRLEAEKVLNSIKNTNNEVIVVQTQSNQNSITSSNVIEQAVVSAEKTEKETEIIALINSYMAQQTYSEKKLQIKLQNEHNITIEEFKKICDKMGINWKDVTKKREEELVASNGNNGKIIVTLLAEEGFDDKDIQTVTEELSNEGKVIN